MERILVLAAGAALSLGACTRAPSAPPELAPGARVQFIAPGSPTWTGGIVGRVEECTALMVPDSWDSASGFRVVRIDSLRELRVSTRFDGLAGEDGRRRTVKLPLDSAGEAWTTLPVKAVRARYGGCAP
ncbi:hypothetical protein [Longimicrobium sp.]|uniref:hypothetical protein n=1 Tax=Longimicrobium sp. TaxID=2029185 RepID=UPI003B3A2811